MKLRGKNFIKVPSIIMLVGAGINLLACLVYLFSDLFYSHALALAAALVGAAQIVAGVLGIKYANRKDKANVCLAVGIVLIGVLLLSNILVAVLDDVTAVTLLSGLLLPVLYIIGACLNRSDNNAQVIQAVPGFQTARPAQSMPVLPQPAAPAPMYSPGGWTCVCGNPGNTGGFCLRCGKGRPAAAPVADPAPTPAPAPKPAPAPTPAQKAEQWTCECGHAGNSCNFCVYCGKPRPAAPAQEPAPETGWTCECGHSGNEGNFCTQCGAKKPEADAAAKLSCPACGWQPEGEGRAPHYCLRCGAALEGPRD